MSSQLSSECSINLHALSISMSISPEGSISKELELSSNPPLFKEELLESDVIIISLWRGLSDIIKASIPIMLGFLVELLTDFLNILFIGQLDDHRLVAACGLGNYTTFMFIFSILIGVASGLDTLCSQAFGAHKLYLFGVYYNTASVLLMLFAIPFIIILLFMDRIMIAIGMEREIAILVGEYVRCLIPYIFLVIQYELLKRFLQTQQIFMPITVVICITTTLQCFWLYLFVIKLGFALRGAALALNITFFLNYSLLYLYIKMNKDKFEYTWIPYEFDNFPLFISRAKEYLSISLPSAVMFIAEAWGIVALGFEAGFLSSTELATHTIVMNLSSLIWVTSFGITVAVCVFVGNSIGKENIPTAIIYSKSALIFCTSIFCIIIPIFYIYRHEYARLFTSDIIVIQRVGEVLPYMLISMYTNAWETVVEGIVRALGKQKISSVTNIISYFVIMHPITICITFPFGAGLGVKGLWIGWFLGTLIAASLNIYFLLKWDWTLIARNARNRMLPGHPLTEQAQGEKGAIIYPQDIDQYIQ